MRVTLEDIRAKFDALCNERASREEIERFAWNAMEANDLGRLEPDPAASQEIWEAITYLSGVALRTDPETYLHSLEDFWQARTKLGI
jgi:hypothetical protein